MSILSFYRFLLFILSLLIFLNSCQGPSTLNHSNDRHQGNLHQQITNSVDVDKAFAHAQQLNDKEKSNHFTTLANYLISQSNYKLAHKVLASIDPTEPNLIQRKKTALAHLALSEKRPILSQKRINNLKLDNSPADRLHFKLLLSQYYNINQQFKEYISTANDALHYAKSQNHKLYKDILVIIWHSMQISSQKNIDSLKTNNNHEIQGWINLRNILDLKKGQVLTDPKKTVQDLAQWEIENPKHPARDLLNPKEYANITPTNKISVLLPFAGKMHSVSQAIQDGITLSYFNVRQENQTLDFIKTDNDSIVNIYNKAIKEGTDAFIGPLLKDDLQQLIQSKNIVKPTLALNYDNTNLTTHFLSQYSLSAVFEVSQLADTMRTQGYLNTIIIRDNTISSEQMANDFTQRFLAKNGKIAETMIISKSDTSKDIAKALGIPNSHDRHRQVESMVGSKIKFVPQRRHDIDSIFIASSNSSARQIIPLLHYHFSEKIPVFSTSNINNGSIDPYANKDLEKVFFFDAPLLISTSSNDNNSSFSNDILQSLKTSKPEHFYENFRFYALGIDSFLLTKTAYLQKIMPEFIIAGCNGNLLRDKNNTIQRILQQMYFKNGIVKLDKIDTPITHAWQQLLKDILLEQK